MQGDNLAFKKLVISYTWNNNTAYCKNRNAFSYMLIKKTVVFCIHRLSAALW